MDLIAAGDPQRGDEGVGCWVLKCVEDQSPGGVICLRLDLVPLELHGLWTRASRVALVHAVASGGAPGTLHHVDARRSPLPARVFRGTAPALGVARAVGLARAMGRLPASLEVWGVEGARFTPGEGLSAEVEAAGRELARALLQRARAPA